ncbi:uncharacterized protein A4U43_C03F9990 [Asparagus officinalis]|uniref:Phytocyanin domain-containing protein n=1 Tax=Asparagus officinalis TaxID=4686 RepID=A0A5P1F9D7_ASPOF|nr:early nodulin-like protein 1 [Asparagus officinalis]ONK74772.1 uncharacterized protein A4U43_C03F9990 [Asparagus officinalis]
MAGFHYLLVLSLALAVSIAAGATQFKVGGPKGWSVPNDPKEYRQWAEKQRFQIGDSLLFVYQRDTDSVALVDESSYRSCDTSASIRTFDDGNTVFKFTRSGPFYFISGNKGNCLKNESLVVVVMADRSSRTSLAPSPSSSASPPPPPPLGSMVFMPSTTNPNEGSNSSNGASHKMMGLMASIGAFIGSLFFVL